ncbi:hypothetical protein Lal_00021085 [Lupinus albus]|nr:hypothetical protein Lal_00021085 [Lupinus albus]
MFFIFQLHSQEVAPNVLSHCLKRDISGGGLLVIGEVVEPCIVYSPLIPKQCSDLHIGKLKSSNTAFDGIFGGGGLLVIGEVVEPYIVYSPLIPKQPRYYLNLESITVNGQMLQIDPKVFKTSSSKGATIDSGTTLAYFIERAYNPIIDAVSFG